jgi:hypothetical protein
LNVKLVDASRNQKVNLPGENKNIIKKGKSVFTLTECWIDSQYQDRKILCNEANLKFFFKQPYHIKILIIKNKQQIPTSECLLPFWVESFVFQFAVQNIKLKYKEL